MKESLLPLLACTACRGGLSLAEPSFEGSEIVSGILCCQACGMSYPIKGGIPRFVPSDDYAGNFSFEWNQFRTTQLDSANGRGESEARFRQSFDFPLENLKGKLVLDGGCGMGRFAEVALKHGATVIGIDLSLAVEAAAKNLGSHPNVHFIQANLFALPFRENTFDMVYSLGVLHHTPDPRRAFKGLACLVRPGGKITITLYSGYNKVYVLSTNFWRRFLPKLPAALLYRLSYAAIPYYYLCRIPFLGFAFLGLFPIPMHPDPEWRVLDTFDCYSPAYQSYHIHYEIFGWFKEEKLTDIAVLEPGISFIGTK